jgi:N-acetylglucosamine malate deacetylase 1
LGVRWDLEIGIWDLTYFPVPVPTVLAIAAHPDDIEFVMAGTLLLLGEAGWQLHYLNLSTGNLGSTTTSPKRTTQVRRREARAAAKELGAVWHAPFCNDLEIFYDPPTLRRLAGVVREVGPDVILTHSPQDYMEDHMNTSRLAVSAAFVRAMPGYATAPKRRAVEKQVTIYHANPHGLRDQLRRRIHPGAFVDTTTVHARKTAALRCHRSQDRFLDATQGMSSYLRTMDDSSREVGRLSGRFEHAEGWRRHLHWGFCGPEDDPLQAALGGRYLVNARYEESLNDAP